MPLPRRTPRPRHAALALAAMLLVLAALAAPAGAMPMEPPHHHALAAPAPTLVQAPVAETPGDGGPSTLAYALTAFGVGLALVGAGALGARIATRDTHAQVS